MMVKSTSLRLLYRVFFVFIALILAVPLQSYQAQAADWYNSSWTYRKAIVIDQTTDLGANAAYQMKLLVGKSSSATGEQVDCNDHCQDDFDDLRFTKSDGTTLLDYWIESVSGSGSSALATVWIETILLDDAADTTIYMYYGNASASAASDGANTFVLFDDFSGASINTDIWEHDTASASVSGGEMTLTTGTSGYYIIKVLHMKSYYNTGYRARMRVKISQYGTDAYVNIGITNTTFDRWLCWRFEYTNNGLFSACYDGTIQETKRGSDRDTGYHIYEIRRISSSSIKYTQDDGSVYEETAHIPTDNLTPGFYVYSESSTATILKSTFVFLSKYTATEPTWKSFGNEEAAAPTVTTQAATLVEETTATGNGNITSLSGGDNCTIRGFQYDIDTGAPYANSAYDSGSFGTGAYTKALTGLTQGELYYIRAYATSPLGTGYGSEVTFLTKPDAPTGFSATAGDSKVDLSWTKGSGAQKTMVRFRTDGTYPTSYTDGTQAYFDTASTYSHTGLTNGTTYKYRMWSYATEGGLTQYSDGYAEATATPAAVPIVTTNDATAVEETTATAGGNITSLSGGSNATVRGVEYDIDSGAPYAHSEYTTGSYGTGTFDIALTGLTQGELYYYRAYATNPTGTGYGSEKTFLTKPEVPTGFNAASFSETQINLSWTKGTGAQKTVIVAKKDSYPANRADGTEVYNDTDTSYSHTGLAEGEHWYYRAWSYATEGGLEQYSDSYVEDNEQTKVPLSVTTGICSGSSETWAILNAEITIADPLPVTVRGFDYGLTSAYGSEVKESGSFGLGTYKLFVENISKSTVFHYRAKAYNGVWKYGADRVFATKGSPALWEYFDATADNTSTIYGANWFAQTFTTDNITSRTVTSIILPLQRTGNSGDVTVSLRNTAGGKPTGIDLCYGTLSQDTIPTSIAKCQFTMNTETPLQLGTQYAIIVRASNGDGSNYVKWDYVNAGGEPNGTGLTSTNSGVAWDIQTWDYLFEIWGNQAVEIQDAKIFQSYKSVGDWLITVRYVNLFAPYYDTYDIRQYFVLQLVDAADHVIAQSPLPAWGNRVGNLYLSAAQVSALDYGGDYTLRIYGTFGSHPYTEYIIQSSDWKGDDLTQLDSWVISSAAVIGDYYDDLLTTYVAGRGEVLNATGGTIFSAGINGLSTVRPALYQVYTNPIDYVPETTSQTQRVAMSNWQAAWGADGTIMLTRIANWFGIDGGLIGGMFFVIMMLVLALVAFPAGHTTAANVLSIPCLGLAVWFGLDLVWLIILALFAAFLLFKNQFMDK